MITDMLQSVSLQNCTPPYMLDIHCCAQLLLSLVGLSIVRAQRVCQPRHAWGGGHEQLELMALGVHV